MKTSMIIFTLIILCSCATKRTRLSDKNMRVMIDPSGINGTDYASIQRALVSSNMWTVLDRSRGLASAKREQEQLHKYSHDRYDRKEKFAHWGKLHGAGSVIVAQSECHNRPNPWNITTLRNYCQLYLSMVDTNTGEVIVTSKVEASADFMASPDWSEAVEKLADAYPTHFREEKLHQRLLDYKEESAANSDKMDRRNGR
jgi:hypothetical protein